MKIHSPFLTGSIQAKPSFINGIVVEGGITGSLQGTASYATVAQSVVGGGRRRCSSWNSIRIYTNCRTRIFTNEFISNRLSIIRHKNRQYKCRHKFIATIY